MNQSYGIIENESRVCIFEESRIHFILLVEPVSRFSLTFTLVPTHLLYIKMCRNYKCAACQINMYVKVATYHKSIIWEQNQFRGCFDLMRCVPHYWTSLGLSVELLWNVLSIWKSSQTHFCSVCNTGSFPIYSGYLVNVWQVYILFVYYFLHKLYFQWQEESEYFTLTADIFCCTQSQNHIDFTYMSLRVLQTWKPQRSNRGMFKYSSLWRPGSCRCDVKSNIALAYHYHKPP